MSPTVTLILDLLMVGLLAATIAYAIILNRQIVKLRESRGEMAELIVGLNEAMSKAETGVRGMKKTASDTGEDLQRAIGKAQALRDELHFMIETGDGLANRLSGSGPSAGENERARPAARPAPAAPRPLAAPRPMVEEAPPPPRRVAAAPPPMAREGAAREGAARDGQERDPIAREGETLSRAERELLQAIENRR